MKRQICNGDVAMLVLLLVCVSSATIIDSVAGGCFSKINSRKKCAGLMYKNLSVAECCGRLGGQYYTAKNASFETLFRHMIKIGMDNCHSCEDWLKGLKPETCKTKTCPSGKVCRKLNGTIGCVCSDSQCKGLNKPICSSLNITYQSECHMKYAACLKGREETAEYNGTCRASCSDVQCSDNKQCIQDQTKILYCVRCNSKQCNGPISDTTKLCGLNNVTYPSACHLRKATCQLGKNIGVAYNGQCRKAKGVANCNTHKCVSGQKCIMVVSRPYCIDCKKSCMLMPGRRVCGSNGYTYPSLCALEKHICFKDTLINVVNYGSCSKGSKRKDNRMTSKKIRKLIKKRISFKQLRQLTNKMGLSFTNKTIKENLNKTMSINNILCHMFKIVYNDDKMWCN